MFFKDSRKLKILILAMIALLLLPDKCLAESVSIKGTMKIHRMGGYIISINYETRDRWTDNIFFKVRCEFDKEELVFTSSSFNNIERGWHETQISISKVIRKRYGSLTGYCVELYKNGILLDTKKAY